MVRCGIDEPEEQTVARYLRGLCREIPDVVVLYQYWSYDDVYKLATKVEKQLKQKNNRSTIGISNQDSSLRKENFNLKTFNKASSSSRTGVNTSTSQKIAPKSQFIKYFKCSGLGYVQADCPNKKFINLAEEAPFVEDSFPQETAQMGSGASQTSPWLCCWNILEPAGNSSKFSNSDS